MPCARVQITGKPR